MEFLEASSKYSYGNTRSAAAIRYIVLHYTGNMTDTAMANARYFSASGYNALHEHRYAGAHYFVDDTTVAQSVPDLRVAYAVGGTNNNGTMCGIVTNKNSISIEMCSTNGVIGAPTIQAAVKLCKELMQKYNIPVDNVHRHYDVTGKRCPGWAGWHGSDAPKWLAFKRHLSDVAAVMPRQVKVTADCLNIRKGPGVQYAVVGTIKDKGIYTIVDVVGHWGRLKSGAGWISLTYTK